MNTNLKLLFNYFQGFPRLSSSATLNIKLLDVNDNPPEFEHTLYMGDVREDNGVGTSVVRVLATSKDAGVNAEISYSIVSGNEKQRFRVHSKSGKYSFSEIEQFKTIVFGCLNFQVDTTTAAHTDSDFKGSLKIFKYLKS